MLKFFNLKYWLNPQPEVFPPLVLNVFFIFLLLFFAGIFVSYIYLKKNKNRVYYQIIKSLQAFFITNFIIGLFLLFFGYETIPYLSARILFLFWGVGIIIHIFFIIKNIKKIPQLKKEFASKKEFYKYIP